MKGPKPTPAADRFWSKVEKSDGCWLWTASCRGPARREAPGYSYGQFMVSKTPRRMASAHRFSWELHFGEIPPGLFVCHRCNVKACVRPGHLYLGTVQQNTADASRDGLLPTGDRSPRSKLTSRVVAQVKTALLTGRFSLSAIGESVGVGHGTIAKIRDGEHWGHVAPASELLISPRPNHGLFGRKRAGLCGTWSPRARRATR